MGINANDTLLQLQNNTNKVQFENSRKNLGSSRLDREGFIRLIMAQLQYQDPTEPKNNSEMLSQQLQLEQADQMKEIVTSNKFSHAGAMVGKEATLVDARWDFGTNTSGAPEWDVQLNQPKHVTGVIESVVFDQTRGKALVKIDGNFYDADMIQELSHTPVTTPTGTAGSSGSTGTTTPTGSSASTDTTSTEGAS